MHVHNRPAIRVIALSAMSAALLLSGCKEEKAATPVTPPVEKKAEAPKPPPPPPMQEQHAEKECAAPVDLAPPQELKIGDRAATLTGYKLSFKDKDQDGTLVLGVLGPVNEDSGENLVNLKKYVAFFKEQKADAIVVTGDVGEQPDGIARVLTALADSKLPVLAVAGNRECRADFTNGVLTAQKTANNVVNLNQVRAVEFPEATLVSLPGYHDPNYMSCRTGCQYFKSTVDEVVRMAKDAQNPVVLVSHGPPHGEGSQALDNASSGGNVGDPQVNRAIKEGNIAFGLFSNIKEAGARAVDTPEGTTLVAENKESKHLYLNPGPADTVGWDMNDGTKSVGMVAVFKLKGDSATWSEFRAKPLSAAEKQQAKALAPAPRMEASETEAKTATPTPPPGQPAGKQAAGEKP